MPDDAFDTLRRLALECSANAYAPYSNLPVGAVGLLSDGSWIPGVRVENASFPLVIPAVTSVYSAMRCAGRDDLVTIVQNLTFRAGDPIFLSEALGARWISRGPDILIRASTVEVPAVADRLEIELNGPPGDDAEMLRRAEQVASRAFITESGFPVGCVVTAEDGSLIPGCNVEHADWTRGLCAERVALATARAYGYRTFKSIHLSCPLEPNATPCGACRQVLFELAPGAPVVMARGSSPPETTTPDDLLPGGFRGDALRS